jgi:N-acetylneuraminate synthase
MPTLENNKEILGFAIYPKMYGEKIDKLWGQERILVNNDKYCGKFLIIEPGFVSSIHMHNVKDETFLVLFGKVKLWLAGETKILERGESYRIKPNTLHRFSSAWNEMSIVLEVSTPHSDEDVVRVEESRRE